MDAKIRWKFEENQDISYLPSTSPTIILIRRENSSFAAGKPGRHRLHQVAKANSH